MAEVESASELGKAAARIRALRKEAEERTNSESVSEAKEIVSEERQMIQSAIKGMTEEIVAALRPLIQLNTEVKNKLGGIEKIQKIAGETLAGLDKSVGELHTGLEDQLKDLLKAVDQSNNTTHDLGRTLGDRLYQIGKTMDASLAILKDMRNTQRDEAHRREDESEVQDHQRSFTRRNYRDEEETDGRAPRGHQPDRKGFLKSFASGMGKASEWFKGFLGFGEGAAGGAIATMFRPLLVGAGAAVLGLIKYGIVGGIVAVIATTLMSSIFQSKKRLEAKGITAFSDQFKAIAVEMYTSLVGLAQSAVGSILSLLSRIPGTTGKVFGKLEEAVNSLGSWLTDFSKTNTKLLQEAEHQFDETKKELTEAEKNLQATEAKLSTLYRQRRRAEAEGNNAKIEQLSAEIQSTEQLRDAQKAQFEKTAKIYAELEKIVAQEKNGGIRKFWDNIVKPVWDSLSATMKSGLEWMADMGKKAGEKWQQFSDFWLNLKDDAIAKLDEWSVNLKKTFIETIPALLNNIGTAIKDTIAALFDLSWWKTKLSALSPSRLFSSAPKATDAPEAAPAAKDALPLVKEEPAKPTLPKLPDAPALKEFFDVKPPAMPPANDDKPVSSVPIPRMQREPTKINPRLDRLERLVTVIAENRQAAQTKMLASVTNVVAPNTVNVVNNQHTQMAVSPRPVSHSTLGALTRAADWG